MTWTDTSFVPTLSLPTSHISEAVDAIERARLALLRADNVEWESVAADHYVGHLSELNSSVAQLARVADGAREKWVRARSAASAWGQL